MRGLFARPCACSLYDADTPRFCNSTFANGLLAHPCRVLADIYLARGRPETLCRRQLKCGTRVRPSVRRLHRAMAAIRREGDRSIC